MSIETDDYWLPPDYSKRQFKYALEPLCTATREYILKVMKNKEDRIAANYLQPKNIDVRLEWDGTDQPIATHVYYSIALTGKRTLKTILRDDPLPARASEAMIGTLCPALRINLAHSVVWKYIIGEVHSLQMQYAEKDGEAIPSVEKMELEVLLDQSRHLQSVHDRICRGFAD